MSATDQKQVRKRQKSGVIDTEKFRVRAKRLAEIINEHGWPTIPLVGRKAGFSAWLVVQHADHDVDFQEKCLRLMQKCLESNPESIEKKHLAFLTDRILFNKKKKQRYGTQFYVNKKGEFTYWPIENIRALSRRRNEYELPSFQEYLDSARNFKPVPLRVRKG